MTEPRPATEPRVQLSKERVLDAAVALAARDGMESLTMRKLAEELGVGAMTLYHYVPNKDVLIDGMVDIVFGEIELPPTDTDWRTAMRRRAISTRQVLNRHRWAVGLMESRRTPGPASLRVHDAVLGCLREAGFSIEQTIQAYSVLDAYIYGFALQEKTVPFETAEEAAAVAEEQVREFAELAGWCRALADRVGADAGPRVRRAMSDAFRTSSEYELAFWQMPFDEAPAGGRRRPELAHRHGAA